MVDLPVANVVEGGFFTDDSFIDGVIFFLPKNTKIKNYHVKLLKDYSLEKISSRGEFNEKGNPQVEDEVEELENIFENNENVIDLTDKDQNKSKTINVKGEIKGGEIDASASFKELQKRWVMQIISFFNTILTTKDINKQNVINFINDIETFLKKNKDDILALIGNDIEGIPRVYRQTLDTVILALNMSYVLGLSDFAKNNLAIAALFHDIGMLKIPKAIIEKKGQLTPDELKIIQGHTIIGFNFLRDIKYSAIIASGALQHHEKVDGTGYPEKKNSDQITNIGKIVAVLDAYSAAISSKPFKDPVHAKEAVQDLLKLGGTHYDIAILKEFVKVVSIYPIGSYVLLSNNLPAKVVANSGIPIRPVVAMINPDGTTEKIDLSKRIDLFIKGIYNLKK